MWTCPKCGRTFARNGQDHYCGKPPETIEEYILNQPEKAQPLLKEINETIRAAIPDTMEKISWSMPTYWKKRNLIQFAAFKNHVGLDVYKRQTLKWSALEWKRAKPSWCLLVMTKYFIPQPPFSF